MHELGISRNIVAIVAEAAKGRRVQCVTLEIGQLSGIVPDAIRFCFDVVAADTAASGAELQIQEIKGRGRCTACGNEFDTPSLLSACRCGSRQLVRLRGEEINVRSIIVEEAV
jgi:hydrogenase nickel incorporation protein HypA/HybF